MYLYYMDFGFVIYESWIRKIRIFESIRIHGSDIRIYSNLGYPDIRIFG